jgi:hypothetical protein
MKTFLAAAALLILTGSAASAQDNPFRTDHFKCYRLEQATQVIPAPVRLLDQWGILQAVVGNIVRLCNPTRKFHDGAVTPIQNPDDHLTLHQLGPQPLPLVNRRVLIRNQFGVQTLITHRARVLAVPTQKSPHGPPQNTDHFNCYAAEGQPLNVPVGLQDQFFGSRHELAQPVLFCNPAQKWHEGNVTPIGNPQDHLTCYRMTPQPFTEQRGIRNQFGEFRIETAVADMACVPTLKLAWDVID